MWPEKKSAKPANVSLPLSKAENKCMAVSARKRLRAPKPRTRRCARTPIKRLPSPLAWARLSAFSPRAVVPKTTDRHATDRHQRLRAAGSFAKRFCAAASRYCGKPDGAADGGSAGGTRASPASDSFGSRRGGVRLPRGGRSYRRAGSLALVALANRGPVDVDCALQRNFRFSVPPFRGSPTQL